MKKNIVIVGTGAVAAEITHCIEDSDAKGLADIKIKGYLDFDENIEKYWKAYKLEKPVLGNIDSYKIDPDDYFIIAIANIPFRKDVIEKIKLKGGKLTNYIHHTAIVNKTAQIGEGNIINPFCLIGPNVVIGNYNLLTAQSVISHDSIVGNNNILSTALLCGHVKVGNNNFFGIRSTVIPNINVGNNNVIQAGMMVDKNILDDSTVFYRFKEKLIAIQK
jgi:sugar O-acyltransferase (sialic acid O-acetyltransferase NeuD family)